MSQQELTATVAELQELRRMKEELDALIEGAQDRVKAYMGETVELIAGAFKVTWRPVTSARLDTKALTAAMPDVAERFTKTSTTRRFTVA
ncbi:hypothetical protein ACH6CV_12840 [Bacillota bacterium Meth-B3]